MRWVQETLPTHCRNMLDSKVKQTFHSHVAEEYVRFIVIHANSNALTTWEIGEASAIYEELEEVKKAVQTGCFQKCKQYAIVAGELCIIGQLVLRGARNIFSSKLHPQVLALAHEGHLGILCTKQNLRTNAW